MISSRPAELEGRSRLGVVSWLPDMGKTDDPVIRYHIQELFGEENDRCKQISPAPEPGLPVRAIYKSALWNSLKGVKTVSLPRL